MRLEGILSVGVLAGVSVALASTRASLEATTFTGVLLMLIGAVEPGPVLAGFSHPAVMSIAALFVAAAGMRATGANQTAAPIQPGRPKSVVAAQSRLMAPVALLSAFINNTPVVKMCVPLVRSWAQRIGVSPSRLLMPPSSASILGGQLTLVGNASNLIVKGLHVESLRAEGQPAALIGIAYRSFDFPKVGAPLTLIPAVHCPLICPLAVPFRPGR